MSSSEIKFDITIGFDPALTGLHLTLINGGLDLVYEGYADRLSLSLPKGVYLLKIVYIDYYQEKYLTIDQKQDFIIEINYPATAPVIPFRTTHEYISGPAEHCSDETKQGTREPDFLFFAAKYDRQANKDSLATGWLKNYSLFNDEKTVNIQLGEKNSLFSNEDGWIGFSEKLKPGLYFFQYSTEKSTRIFPVYIYEGFQTQFFLRYNAGPDFENSIFFYSSRMNFRRHYEEYLVLDRILFAYADYKNYKEISERDFEIIQQHPFLVAMINILQLALGKPVFDEYESLYLPDSKYIKKNGDNLFPVSDLPPVMSFVMKKYTHNTESGEILFLPASLVDRIIDHTGPDIFWNNFSMIEDAGDLKTVYKKLMSVKTDSPAAAASLATRLVKVMAKSIKSLFMKRVIPAVESNIPKLDAMLMAPENSMGELTKSIENADKVSAISKEFGLPPTTVFRKYKNYAEIYDKLKAKKES